MYKFETATKSIYHNMKKLFLTVMASFAIMCALAQSSSPKLSIGPEVALPLGDAQIRHSVGVGGTLKLEFPVSQSNFSFTVTTGYINFSSKKFYTYTVGPAPTYTVTTSTFQTEHVAAIPVKVGGKYYAGKMFYVEAEAGIAKGVDKGDTWTAFAYSPGMGVSFPFATQKAIDLGLHYEGWVKDSGNFNQLALRLAYKFGL